MIACLQTTTAIETSAFQWLNILLNHTLELVNTAYQWGNTQAKEQENLSGFSSYRLLGRPLVGPSSD